MKKSKEKIAMPILMHLSRRKMKKKRIRKERKEKKVKKRKRKKEKKMRKKRKETMMTRKRILIEIQWTCACIN